MKIVQFLLDYIEDIIGIKKIKIELGLKHTSASFIRIVISLFAL
jgi:hypothetical protein